MLTTSTIESNGRAKNISKDDFLLFEQLRNAVELAAQGREDEALAISRALRQICSTRHSLSSNICKIYTDAIEARITKEICTKGNLYANLSTPEAMIRAFQVLVDETPLVQFGYSLANAALIAHLGDDDEFQIIDIGIGAGTQWFRFLDALSSLKRKPTQIRLVGIDIPFSESEPTKRLNALGSVLQRYSLERGIKLRFDAVAAKIEELDFHTLPLSPSQKLGVNAHLALHHVPPKSVAGKEHSCRQTILTKICSLNPSIFTLVEPDSNHDSLPLLPRLYESLIHYTTIFEALSIVLKDHGEAKHTLETSFFGNEIMNIIAAEGSDRTERHQRREAWHTKLLNSGFRSLGMGLFLEDKSSVFRIAPPFELSSDNGFALLSLREVPLLAASAWSA